MCTLRSFIHPFVRYVALYLAPSATSTSDWVMELADIRRAIHHLVKDSNPDVRHFVSFLPPILRNDLSQEEKARAVLWLLTVPLLSLSLSFVCCSVVVVVLVVSTPKVGDEADLPMPVACVKIT